MPRSTLLIDCASAVIDAISLGDGPRPGEAVDVRLVEEESRENFACQARALEDDGRVRIALRLPHTLFDGRCHDIAAYSDFWEGPVSGKLLALDEHGHIIPDRSLEHRHGGYKGAVSFFDGALIRGWGLNEDAPGERISVALLIDNKKWSVSVADEFRRGLMQYGNGEGRCGFSHSVPDVILDGKAHVVSCIFVDTGEVLTDGIISIELGELRKFLYREIHWRIRRIQQYMDL